MRKLLALVAALALAVPAIALVAKPAQPGQSVQPGKSAPKVQYVMKGTLTSFTASAGGADGSIAFTVTKSNHQRAGLKDKALTLLVKPSTKVVFDTDGQLTAGETVVVKVRELKRTTDASTLLNGKEARQVIDQGGTTEESTEGTTDGSTDT
jgi:hypothetical protein